MRTSMSLKTDRLLDNSAANMEVIRQIALLVKSEKTAVGVKKKRLKAGWDEIIC
jgi:hypothetical protein